MNLFHQLIDDADGHRLSEEMHGKPLNGLWETVFGCANETQCFLVGDVTNWYDMRIIPELSGLPFEKCNFQFTGRDGQENQVICHKGKGDGIVKQYTFVKFSDGWRFAWYATYLVAPDGRWNMTGAEGCVNDSRLNEVAMFDSQVVCAFLSALHCKNVKKREIPAPKNLNKKRAKKGKTPIFSYWVLDLAKPDAERGEHQGGTHSAPRVHLRRGHPRQYAPGKYTWVQPCVVGSGPGAVKKDYAYGQEAVE